MADFSAAVSQQQSVADIERLCLHGRSLLPQLRLLELQLAALLLDQPFSSTLTPHFGEFSLPAHFNYHGVFIVVVVVSVVVATSYSALYQFVRRRSSASSVAASIFLSAAATFAHDRHT